MLLSELTIVPHLLMIVGVTLTGHATQVSAARRLDSMSLGSISNTGVLHFHISIEHFKLLPFDMDF